MGRNPSSFRGVKKQHVEGRKLSSSRDNMRRMGVLRSPLPLLLGESRHSCAFICVISKYLLRTYPMVDSVPRYRHTSFYCTQLYCTLQILHYFMGQRFVATLCQAGLFVPFSQEQLLTLCHILIILANISLLLYLLW